MALSAIALANQALLRIGAAGIHGFADDAVEAQIAGALYGPIRDGLLSAHPWSFATAQRGLNRLTETPVADHAHAFQLPPGFLRVLSAGTGTRGRGIAYRIAGPRLLCDADSVTLTYIFRPDEADIPAFFDQALIARLAAEFCIPLTETTSRAEALLRLAEAELRRARLTDSQQETPRGFEDFSLIEVRR